MKSCINLHLPIVILKKSILLDMHDYKTYMYINFQQNRLIHQSVRCTQFYSQTRCTRGVRVVFSVTRMRSSSSARINKFDFRTEKSCSVHMTVFEIVAGHNVVNWMQLLT